MQIDQTWYSAIHIRRSQRSYDPARPMEPELLDKLRTACTELQPFPSARAVLVQGSAAEVFKGAIGSYGKIKNAGAFIAFVGDMDCPNVQEQVGYTGEAIILQATVLGLSTCWVGGYFRRPVAAELARTGPSERVLAVAPVGYRAPKLTLEEQMQARFGLRHRRKPLSDLVAGLPMDRWPAWCTAALEAARLAPSAVNRQPWRFAVAPAWITVSIGGLPLDMVVSRRLDAGIAMLHLELGALSQDVRGHWEYLTRPEVARFHAERPS
jgi:nitroreductase